MNTKQIVEIKGVKLELDYREGTRTRIETFRVGTKVKVLMKGYGGYEVKAGVIVGFDAFEKLPTIKVATVNAAYGQNPVQFVNFNENTDGELIAAEDDTELLVNKDQVIDTLTRNVEEQRLRYEASQEALKFFIKHFGEKVAEPQVA